MGPISRRGRSALAIATTRSSTSTARCARSRHRAAGLCTASASKVRSDRAGALASRVVRVLLVSTYELGHQPLHVASPAAALRAAGHDVRCVDLSVERWDRAALDQADAVAFSVPMHTAMRLAMRAAQQVRDARPEMPICFYGLYAPVSRDLTLGRLADRLIAGEYEPALVEWASTLDGGETLDLGRHAFEVPARDMLPPLERYAHLALGGEERVVGYVEASHGCVHRCRHCPVPVVYDGRIRGVAQEGG